MEKQKITVRVAGKAYTLVSSDPPEHMRRVAGLVDRKLREMELATALPPVQVLTLTCLNLEDQLVKAEDEIRELKRRSMAAEQQAAAERRASEKQQASADRKAGAER